MQRFAGFRSQKKNKIMANFLLALTPLCFIVLVSCKKNNDNASNLELLRHKWMLVSENGEALRYVGNTDDFYDFAMDSKLYRHINKTNDTSFYDLLPKGKTLSLYQVTNGIKSATAIGFTIKTLTDSQLILSYSNGIIFSLDSLER
jgi:hypothetical protein